MSLNENDSCAIVGAGLSGLVAARTLENAGVRVTVFERDEKVGGRMRTDLLNGGVFDHGAQFFTARSDRFMEMVEGWLSVGVAEVWNRGFADVSGEQQEDGHPRYKGTDGMTTIADHLASGLDVRTGSEVMAIEADAGAWRIIAGGLAHPAEGLVLAAPVPLVLPLVDGVSLPAGTRETLQGIAYDPCIAVMALLDGPGNVPEPGGVQIGGDPLFFVADNHKKGISGVPALTIHAGPEFSREHAHTDDARVTELLLEEARDYLGTGIEATAVYRWEHSQVTDPHEKPFVFVKGPPPLIFCGDAYAGPKVEGAVLSGLAAAEKLLGVS